MAEAASSTWGDFLGAVGDIGKDLGKTWGQEAIKNHYGENDTEQQHEISPTGTITQTGQPWSIGGLELNKPAVIVAGVAIVLAVIVWAIRD
jgi:hypothetical protein